MSISDRKLKTISWDNFSKKNFETHTNRDHHDHLNNAQTKTNLTKRLLCSEVIRMLLGQEVIINTDEWRFTELWSNNILGCKKERAIVASIFHIKERLTWYPSQQATESGLNDPREYWGLDKILNFSKIARKVLARSIRK